MNPIITSNKFERLDHPRAIGPLINDKHRMHRVLLTMCFHHPRIFSRDELMEIGGFWGAERLVYDSFFKRHRRVRGDGVTEFTSFHFWMLRINDTLPRTGWRVNDTQGYRLQRISLEHEVRLREKLNREVAA